MTKVQRNKFKRVLVSSINKHLKSGGKLIASDFFLGDNVDDTNCRCPIQTVMGAIGGDASKSTATSTLLSKKVGFAIKRDAMFAFINGYDNEPMSHSQLLHVSYEEYLDMYNLGKEIRKEFKPLTKAQMNKIGDKLHG